MANLGTLTLDMIAKTGGFTGPIDKAARKSKDSSKGIIKDQESIQSKLKTSITSFAKWGAAGGVAAAAAAVAFTKMSFKAADEIGKVASTAGITTDTLQEMRHAATISGVSFEDLDKGMQQFNKRIGESRASTGALYTYLTKIDKALLSQVQSAKSSDAALNMVFKSMKDMSSSSDRAALSVAAFGRSGQRLAIMADTYEALRKEARDLGLVIDEDLIRGAEAANDKMSTMSRIISTQLTSAVLELAPALQAIAQAMIDISPGIAWLMGGEKRSNETLKGLMDIQQEMQGLNLLLKEQRDIQTMLLQLKAKGSWYDPNELEQVENNIESIINSVKELNSQGVPGKGFDGSDSSGISQEQMVTMYKSAFSSLENITKKTYDVMKSEYEKDRDEFITLTGDKETAQAIYAKKIESLNEKLSGPNDEWKQLEEVIKSTSDHNKQKLDLIKKSNNAIKSERDMQLQEDIARDENYRSIVEQADMAEINNIENNIERELAMHNYKFDKLKEMYSGKGEELLEIERLQAAELAQINSGSGGSYWEEYLLSLENNMQNMDTIIGDSVNGWTSKFGDFFASAIFDSENLGESFKNMAIGMGKSMVSAIGQMIAQWMVYKVTKIAVDKSTKAAAIPAMIANAQAASMMAGINAYASAAAIPIVGFGMAPAAMGAALATTGPMAAAIAALSLAGMAHDGMDSVPDTGTWLLKKGERVVTSKTSQKLDNTLSRLQNDSGYGATPYNTTSNNRGYEKSSHYHYHSEGPTFFNRSQMKDAARILMEESEREKTRRGAL